MPDSRIKDFTEEWFKCYQAKYSLSPMWGGKEAKRTQDMWKWVDKNGVDPGKVYEAILNYFNDDGFAKEQAHPLELFFKGISKYMQAPKKTPEQHGKDIIEKAKKMFMESQVRIEERLKVEDKTLSDFGMYFAERYSKDELGCAEWVKKQRVTMNISEAMKDKESRIYQLWVKEGKAAREYFGSEMVSKLWKSEPSQKPISEQIKKAKEIEINS
jgi:hypothetical protein